jgi:hypothetical protein
MSKPVTIVITPRDRYSDLDKCINELYANTDESLFDLIVLDLGYPKSDMDLALKALANKTNYRLFNYGRIIPMAAMARVRNEIQTRYAVFIDNDSRAFEPWLPQLVATAIEKDAAVIYPVTLERAGVDEGADVRCHLFTTELKYVNVGDTPYLIEHKTQRRTLPQDLPQEVTETQAFELHCVMFNTAVLKTLELPQITIREHLDIGMQLQARNLKLWVEPRCHIMFDNLGTPARYSDLDYFNLRWNGDITNKSSRLFEKRWGYKFYSEPAIYHWANRRRIFLLLRWLRMPIKVANMCDRLYSAYIRRFKPIWDPMKDPYTPARQLYEKYPNRQPVQLDHAIE